jgi:hypothetical protein
MANIRGIGNTCTQCLVWKSLFDMVMDTRILKVTEFIDLALENLHSIESVSVIQPLLGSL